MPSWYLAQAKPNADQIAKRNLDRQNFLTFQPLERRTRVRGGQFASTLRPFFPGYLFLSHPEPIAPWALVSSTYGVARLVSFGGKPALVPGQIIAALKDACDADGVLMIDHQLEVGARVAITNGPFDAFVGEVERLTPDRRALVLLDFMGKQTRVTLPAGDLRPSAMPAEPRLVRR